MTKDRDAYFQFLDNLRESGATNMFGAAPYLQLTFNLSGAEARTVLAEWMETFASRHDLKNE